MKNILRRYRTPCPCRSCAKKRLHNQTIKSTLQQQQLVEKKLRDAERARNCYQRRKEREGEIPESTLFLYAAHVATTVCVINCASKSHVFQWSFDAQ